MGIHRQTRRLQVGPASRFTRGFRPAFAVMASTPSGLRCALVTRDAATKEDRETSESRSSARPHHRQSRAPAHPSSRRLGGRGLHRAQCGRDRAADSGAHEGRDSFPRADARALDQTRPFNRRRGREIPPRHGLQGRPPPQEGTRAFAVALRAAGRNDTVVPKVGSSATSFASYGFPESHAIDFAILAYVSTRLTVHSPAPVYASLLNNQPRGSTRPPLSSITALATA